MIVLVVVAAFVVVVALAAWSRHAGGRAERRSMQTYGRTLGVLGDVSRRSEKRTPLRPPAGEEVARPHVRPNEGGDLLRPAAPSGPDVPAPRVRLQPPSLPGRPRIGEAAAALSGRSAPRHLVGPPSVGEPASDRPGAGGPAGEEPAAEELQILFDDASPAQAPAEKAGRELRHLAPVHEQGLRRAAAGAAAAVVLAALGVGGYELVSSRTPAVHGATGARTGDNSAGHHRATPRSGASTPPTTSTTLPPAAPTKLEPTSQSTSVVAYAVPEQSYTVTLTAGSGGACWIGVEQSVNGPYLWMDTLAPGATSTYKANGPVVVRVGNPRVLSLAVNGLKVDLPAGRVQVYDVTLTPTGTVSAA